MSSGSEAAKKAWRTRRAKKAAITRKDRKRREKLGGIAEEENRKRREVQELVKTRLKAWWKKEYLSGPPSRPKPLVCIVCGEGSKLGLSIHHIDPELKKGDSAYNSYENQAAICGTCHNLITYKKSQNPKDILEAIDSRHRMALKKGLLST